MSGAGPSTEMPSMPQQPDGAATHVLEITADVLLIRGGRRIRYHCPDCDTRGELTAPPAKAGELFDLLRDGHCELRLSR